MASNTFRAHNGWGSCSLAMALGPCLCQPLVLLRLWCRGGEPCIDDYNDCIWWVQTLGPLVGEELLRSLRIWCLWAGGNKDNRYVDQRMLGNAFLKMKCKHPRGNLQVKSSGHKILSLQYMHHHDDPSGARLSRRWRGSSNWESHISDLCPQFFSIIHSIGDCFLVFAPNLGMDIASICLRSALPPRTILGSPLLCFADRIRRQNLL